MLLPVIEHRLESFYMNDKKDNELLRELLNNPKVTIIEKHFDVETEKEFEGDTVTVTTKPFCRVEYEICSL